jgi:adenylate cyclase
LHRQAAQWLEQVTERIGRTDEFSTLIAGHYEQAGDTLSASEWYWRAGQGAAFRYANAEALHAFSRALELSRPEDIERQFEIRLSREKVYDLLGLRDEQLLELEELQELAERLADPAWQARVALRRAAYAFSVSDFPAVIASAQKASEQAKVAQVVDVVAESDLLQSNALTRQGSLDEARELAERGLKLARHYGLRRVEASSLRQLGLIAYYLGDHQEARARFADALQLYIQIGDRQGEGMAVNNLGGASFELGDHQQAKVYYSRSLELCRQIGDRMGEGRALNNLGIIAVVQSDYDRAEAYYLQALQISRETGHRSFEMSALDNLGNLALYRYQFTRAKTYQLEALRGARQIGDRVTESYSLVNLARSCLMTGDYQTAYDYIQSGLELIREIGDPQGECAMLVDLSYYHCETGNLEAARDRAREALDQSRELGFQSEEAWALHLLGEAEWHSGHAREAYEYYQAALEARRELGEDGEACDSQAGMARACLSLGDMEQAMAQVEQLLDTWEMRGTLGLDQPIQDMLICYQVLAAAQDPRAPGLLERGYRLLQECATNIEEENLRRAFLENVRANRELLEIWRDARG